MPELTEFNWIVICVCLMTLSGLATFFLKDVFKKHDKHNDNINDIQKDYAPRSELNSAMAALRDERKAQDTKISEHEKDINEIKRTYVTKDELKELKGELRDDYKKLVDDVGDIKANFLPKSEFHDTILSINRSIQESAKDNAQKYDKMYDILLELKGEIASAKK